MKNDEQLCSRCFAHKDGLGCVDISAEAELYESIVCLNLLEVVRTLLFGEACFCKQAGERFLLDTILGACVETRLLSALYCLFFDPSSQKCRLNGPCEKPAGGSLRTTHLTRLAGRYRRLVENSGGSRR